ncbi:serine/threonine-protein kinase [Dictyobacter aurantiacus]|uniref:non-specific serine/threonine protein kinase n=1 Tax=Dictyobacter aurantiacus TaxID=1936993 RepID=A0A401Z7D1_9CHLR|nr:serine/threonine-protein kinase [Dictyobacter aurantiacus]GCE02761.1 hypothetical protein KDAU_00900 [Dictyobacter aurantiacus]
MEQEQQVGAVPSLSMIGRYRVLRRIGRGGMGDVWLCEDPRLHRQVAIKTLPSHSQGDQEFVTRFEREAEAAASLAHPHILSVHDYGKQTMLDGSVVTYIVMSYIQGGTLADRIAYYEQRRMMPPLFEMLSLLEQAAQAIDYVHKKRLIHRDIKPANMLLRDNDWVLLADFGIARIVSDADHMTQGNLLAGTPGYMAPEQASGKATIASDNYSLAVIIYQLSTGRLPFQGETALATMMQHQLQPPPAPRQFNPALTPAFEQILLQGLEKDPNQRPAQAVDFVSQLKRALTDISFQPTALSTIRDLSALNFHEDSTITEVSPEEKQRQRQQLTRRRVLWGLGGTTAAVVVSGAGLDIWEYFTHRPPDQVALTAPTSISARPTQSGPNQPVLVLTGHEREASSLLWSRNSLISIDQDTMTLLWDIGRLQQYPDRAPGKPFYSARLAGTPASDDLKSLLSFYLASSPDGQKIAIFNTAIVQGKSTQIITCTADLQAPRKLDVQQVQYFAGAAWLQSNYLVGLGQFGNISDTRKYSYALYVIDPAEPRRQWVLKAEQLANVLVSIPYQITSVNRILADPTKGSSLLAVQYNNQITVGQVTISDKAYWRARGHISVPMNMQRMAWTPDGKSLLAVYGTTNADMNKWSLGIIPIQNVLSSTSQKAVQPVSELTLPDFPTIADEYTCIAATSRMVAIGDSRGEISIWKLSTDSASSSPPTKLRTSGIQAAVQQLSWSQDGKWLAASFVDQQSSILIWKL